MRLALGLVLVCLAPTAVWAQAPRVLDSIPRNGDLQVDPSLNRTVFLFDQDMAMTGYTFCAGGSTFPKLLDALQWLDARVLLLRMQLEPNHQYQFTLNCSGSSQYFQDIFGRPLQACAVAFRTGTGATEATLTPEINSKAVQEFRRVIDEEYSYRDLRGVDWPGLFAQYGPALIQAKTATQFAQTAATLLSQAKDLHITVTTASGSIQPFVPQLTPNLNIALLPKIVPNFSQPNSTVCLGRYADGMRYILIATWSADSAVALDQVYPALWEAASESGLIIDVRPNTGGEETLAQQIAGCFVEESHVYARRLERSTTPGGGFTSLVDAVLVPDEERPRCRGPVAVLMGPANVSSCEDFLLMMKQVSKSALIGEKSYGASGDPLPHDLGNGVTVFLPSWKGLRLDGTCFETEGIAPDIEIHATKEQLAVSDPVLDAALVWLRQNRPWNSVVAQRHDRIDAGGTARGIHAGEEAD